EFSREIVKRTVVEDELPELMAERAGVDQFKGVDARRGIGGEIADVVSARAARVKTDALDAPQDFRRVLDFDEADLNVRPRGDLDVAGGEILCDARDFPELKGLELAGRNA